MQINYNILCVCYQMTQNYKINYEIWELRGNDEIYVGCFVVTYPVLNFCHFEAILNWLTFCYMTVIVLLCGSISIFMFANIIFMYSGIAVRESIN